MLKKLSYFIATYGYSGCLPKAPGTWGTIAGCLTYYLAYEYCRNFIPYLLVGQVILGIIVSHHLIKASAETDPSYIVIDEVVGIWIPLILLGFHTYNIFTVGLMFFLFRLFDIWKPFPIAWIEKKLEKRKNTQALGIMLDDILAAIMAIIVYLGICTILFFLPG